MSTPDHLILKNKMGKWGPFEENEGKWLIFSIGNPEEGHGYALPRMADDYQAQAVAMKIARKSGSRYIAHIPWSTDGAGEAAKDWSPNFVPVPVITEKIIEFMKPLIKNYIDMGLPGDRVFVYSGHGGNNPLKAHEQEFKEKLGVTEFLMSSTDIAEKNMGEIMQAIQNLAMEMAPNMNLSVEDTMKFLGAILMTGGHASHFEHSMCAAIGIIDMEKLQVMNQELSENLEEALKKWPPVGGLGGYLLNGGKYLEAFGTPEEDPHGLWNCLKGLRELNNGQVLVVPELGNLMIELASTYFADILTGKRKP